MSLSTRRIQCILTDPGLLMAEGKQMQAVSHDGQELLVVLAQQAYHLRNAARSAHGRLGALLVQQQVVQCRDCVEQHRVDRRPELFL